MLIQGMAVDLDATELTYNEQFESLSNLKLDLKLVRCGLLDEAFALSIECALIVRIVHVHQSAG